MVDPADFLLKRKIMGADSGFHYSLFCASARAGANKKSSNRPFNPGRGLALFMSLRHQYNLPTSLQISIYSSGILERKP